MDQNNLSDVISLANSDADIGKVRLFLKNGIVPDPYHDDNQFDPVYLMIEKRCKEIIEEFCSNR
jgi:protein-tyrosine phosphatase